MNSDDVLAYLAGLPKRERPTELKSDSAMLLAWRLMRKDGYFYWDVVVRHGLHKISGVDGITPARDEHAIGNAWGHCVQEVLEHKRKR